jgi:exonuclease 3'-5' domain-containing protein 2
VLSPIALSYQVCNASPLNIREIQIVNSLDEAKTIARRLKTECQDYSVLGFDCEWLTVSGKRRPVSLLQLSSHTGLCALFRLCHMKAIPLELRELLEDDSILKVGVAPNDDAAHMAYDFSVGVASTLDLRYLADLVGSKGEGLAKMSEEHLNSE